MPHIEINIASLDKKFISFKYINTFLKNDIVKEVICLVAFSKGHLCYKEQSHPNYRL